MLKIPAAAACTAAALAIGAAPASAAVLVVTYQGFASGRAAPETFGMPADFQNVAYEAAFTIDAALGAAIPTPDGTVVEGSGPTSPVLSAFIRINGVRRDVAPSFGRLRLDPVAMTVSHVIESRAGGLTLFQLSTTFSTPPTSFEDAPAGVVGGSGGFLAYDDQGRETVSLTLTADRLVIAPPAAGPPPGSTVPEPTAWALMILGFGGAGASLRRSRRAASA
jgi:hypothetical protein